VDAFFREQDERMNASDSDWEQYEERVHQERKRKREQRRQEKQKAREGKSAVQSGQFSEDESAKAPKRQKLPEVDDPMELPSSVQQPSSSSTTLLLQAVDKSPQGREVFVVSSHRKSSRISLAKVHKHHTKPHASSNVTTPATSPMNREVSISMLPQTLKDCETSDNPSKSTSTRLSSEIATKSGNSKPEGAKRRVGPRSASTVKSTRTIKQEAERLKKTRQDTEALMTPLEYAAILHQKWQARVSNTPPEKLFLKDCIIFLVFEEKNKSTKDTRIKLDIVSDKPAYELHIS